MAGTITLQGDRQLAAALRRLSQADFDKVVQDNMRKIYNRGKRGGTPVDSGELVASLGFTPDGGDSEVGYTKEYAPHVEYGHRQNVGQFVPKLGKRLKASYVPGQHYLAANVAAQGPKLHSALKRELRRAGT